MIAAVRLQRLAALDRTPYGPCLAGQVWDAVMSHPLKDGLIGAAHRDYCGHGLIHVANGLILADVDDGGLIISPAIATWTDRAAFVEFLGRQSDYSCSGWDASEPVFATEDDWYRDNQRLTRATIRRGLRSRPRSTGR